jgi:hypothetical protein
MLRASKPISRRDFGKWVLRGGVLVPALRGLVPVRAQIIRARNLIQPLNSAGGGGATPVFVGITNGTNSSGTTIAVTRTLTASNWVAVCVGWEDVTNTSCTVADNSGGANTYTGGTLANGQTANAGPLCQMFYALVSSGGSRTITATFGASSGFSCISVVEFSGGLSALDVQGAANGNSPAPATSNFTTTTANEALVCCAKNYGGSAATPQTNWTEDVDNTSSNGFEVQHRIVSATGTYNGAATYAGGQDQDWTIVAMAFK